MTIITTRALNGRSQCLACMHSCQVIIARRSEIPEWCVSFSAVRARTSGGVFKWPQRTSIDNV